PLALAELGFIDEYEFVAHPRLAGHGPTVFAGLSKYVDLKLVSRREFGSGAVAMRYEPREPSVCRSTPRRTNRPGAASLQFAASVASTATNRYIWPDAGQAVHCFTL